MHLLTCVQATRLMSEAQERELAFTERLPLKVHVMMCSGCRHFQTQMGVLRRLARAYAQGQDERAASPDDGGRPPTSA
ncbi:MULTISPECIES: zf-HC2 domain-containing protein [Caldimonas]|jgi:predicted anti-sigma-YlaC factor YlaD|uniref:zf-HC2 domain-containing protein n=1 Tax=Caldimonas TaxID=196013 RepID=UPI00036E54C3|nr:MULTISPECIES: zf-HC2 domain-containing protein [Caldimonas]MCX7660420.1 zf-HC2 domain-containing protein [Caldimonas manganoxidans]GIX23546.1 MAG: hypothetical protein KatS3mg122_0777 [Caldimonas sp.]